MLYAELLVRMLEFPEHLLPEVSLESWRSLAEEFDIPEYHAPYIFHTTYCQNCGHIFTLGAGFQTLITPQCLHCTHPTRFGQLTHPFNCVVLYLPYTHNSVKLEVEKILVRKNNLK